MRDPSLDSDERLAITPVAGPFSCELRPPGSKSLSNRHVLLAALANGRSTLDRALRSDDVDGLVTALSALGVTCERPSDDRLVIDGVGGRFPHGADVHLGDGGTPTRFMLAAAALADGPVRIDGSARMRERPVGDGVDLLRALGVEIDARSLPVTVRGIGSVHGGMLEVGAMASSQFVSALLLCAPWYDRGLRVTFREPATSWTYIDLTIQALEAWGATIAVERFPDGAPGAIEIAPRPLRARSVDVEPDASSAIYWFAAAASVPGARVRVPLAPDSAQPDARAVDVLEEMGALVERGNGVTTVHGRDLRGVEVDCAAFPDAAVMLVALAALASGPSRFTGLGTLRVKETDRVHALATELRAIGCAVKTEHDAIAVTPPETPRDDSVEIGTWNDHRMAMAFGIVGLVRPGLTLRDPGCVAKSYPSFWRDFEHLREG